MMPPGLSEFDAVSCALYPRDEGLYFDSEGVSTLMKRPYGMGVFGQSI